MRKRLNLIGVFPVAIADLQHDGYPTFTAVFQDESDKPCTFCNKDGVVLLPFFKNEQIYFTPTDRKIKLDRYTIGKFIDHNDIHAMFDADYMIASDFTEHAWKIIPAEAKPTEQPVGKLTYKEKSYYIIPVSTSTKEGDVLLYAKRDKNGIELDLITVQGEPTVYYGDKLDIAVSTGDVLVAKELLTYPGDRYNGREDITRVTGVVIETSPGSPYYASSIQVINYKPYGVEF